MVENPLRSSRVMWGWLLAGVAGALLLAVWAFRGRELPPGVARPAGERLTRNESVEVGGVKRPVTDIRRPESRKTTKSGESPLRHALPRLPIEKSDHPQVASVLEAAKSGSHPERLSTLVPPKAFDPAAYAVDPQAYLSTSEPGRVWQVAQPGRGVPRLVSLAPEMQQVEQGEPVLLKVKVLAGAPVTFTSFDLGAFENELTSITVAADQQGVARATFTGTGGTRGEVQILASSPLTSGQAQFLVDVAYPKQPRSVPGGKPVAKSP